MNRYRCRICGFLYEEKHGISERENAPGTAWETLPASWRCPICGAGKADFAQEREPDGAQKAGCAFPALGSGPQEREKGETRPDAFSFEERSTIFSNLAKGCEKQHAMKEAELFHELSAYFQKREDAKPAGELRQLAEAMRVDLTEITRMPLPPPL